jgi:erythromycin esterase-like protein
MPVRDGLADLVIPLDGGPGDDDRVIDRARDADLVLIGEATHGTHEFYARRADLTRRLITRHGFRAVALEADWPDVERVDAYARGTGDDRSAEEALGDFGRFPAWMWRNRVTAGFVEWLRGHNAGCPPGEAVRMHGLDLYALGV